MLSKQKHQCPHITRNTDFKQRSSSSNNKTNKQQRTVAVVRESVSSQANTCNLAFYINELEKEQTELKANRREEMIRSIEEINEM